MAIARSTSANLQATWSLLDLKKPKRASGGVEEKASKSIKLTSSNQQKMAKAAHGNPI